RAAIQAANSNPGADVIAFAAGLSGSVTLTSGQLDVTDSATISGPGASQLTVSGNNVSRVFEVAPTATVALSGLPVANGAGTDEGGGILNWGTLTLDSVSVANNRCFGLEVGDGGGITNYGTLTVRASTIRDNQVSTYLGGGGGGIASSRTLLIENSA